MSPAFYIVLAFAIAVLVTLFVIVARTLPSRHQQQNVDENAENQDGQDEVRYSY
jgi:heme exporter protein D